MTMEGIERAIERVRVLEPETQARAKDAAVARLKDAIAVKKAAGVMTAALVRELLAADIGVGESVLRRFVGSAPSGGKRVRPKRSARGSTEARAAEKPLTPVPAIAPTIAQSAANATPTPAKPPKVDLNRSYRREF
jgi:hypothetical protein